MVTAVSRTVSTVMRGSLPCVSILILFYIEICQYAGCHETADRSRRPTPTGCRGPHKACNPSSAQRVTRGLRVRLHRLLLCQPAARLASLQGAPRGWLDRGGTPWSLGVVLAAPGGGGSVQGARGWARRDPAADQRGRGHTGT